MIMEEFEYRGLLKQLNEKQSLHLMMLCIESNCNLIHRYVYFL
jgi:hypothetical protein